MARISMITMFLLAADQILLASTTVQFNPTRAEVGPFPTDALTVADSAQKTGLRMNLPKPDCEAQPSTCAEIGLINELDGFSIAPRVTVRFSGKVKLDTLRSGISIVWLDNLTKEESGLQPSGHVTKINEIQYDPGTNTAYAKPDELLDQHRRYALVITNAVADADGSPVEMAPEFSACLGGSDGYCGQIHKLADSLQSQFQANKIVAASIFTTLSATAWIEKARDQLANTSPGYWSAGTRIFKVADLVSITLQSQTQTAPVKFQPSDMSLFMLNGVGRIAFGSFYSPNFLNDQWFIPAVPTGQDVALPAEFREIPFVVFLPQQPAPPGGYPVVVAGQGAQIIDLDWGTWLASGMLSHGFATIAFNTFGWGPGPESYLMVKETNGRTSRIRYPGRAVDIAGNGTYVQGAGCYVESGPHPVQIRDCFRQTALDALQLVRMIKGGVDLDGNGTVDLDANQINYSGYSMGAMWGTLLTALSPDLKAAVLNSAAGRWTEAEAWSGGIFGRDIPNTIVGARSPSLLNKGKDFDFDSVLRDQPAHLISVPGALEIQELIERIQWLTMPGDAIAYGPHLKPTTLPGISPRPVMFQFSKGDHILPNPFESALVRAADMLPTTSLYRHDLACAIFPDLLPEGHLFMWPIGPRTMTNPLAQYMIFAMAVEQQAGFFRSGGKSIPDLSPLMQYWFGQNLFETPAARLPDELNY